MSSDEEGTNPVSHKKLLSEINDIVKFQHIKKPKRSEPTSKISEFNLVKTKADDENGEEKFDKKSVQVGLVAQIVKKSDNQKKNIGKQLQATFKKDKILQKPLEKVHADRIQRTVAYDSTRSKLSRWDAIVTKNKNAEQLKFPLNNDRAHYTVDKSQPAFSQVRFKTQMVREMEEITNECFPKEQEAENDDPSTDLLTLEEMKERRKELSLLRNKESQKIAKKRLQGKIKSKKYHRLRKREELKQKLKDFEELKISNPEAALRELEKIEKQRVLERTNLRHKNTGTWAKNMKVRAQYDETAKQELEAQLALGRELTQKNNVEDSSDSENDQEMPTASTNNPWLEDTKKGDELDEIFSGYRAFWEEKNATEKKKKKIENKQKKEIIIEEPDAEEEEDEEMEESGSEESDQEVTMNSSGWIEEDITDDENPSNFINDLFDKAEEKLSNKMEAKLKDLKPKLMDVVESKQKKGKKSKKTPQHDSKYLEFAKEAKLADIDEALNEGNKSEEDEVEIRPSKRLLNEIEIIKEQKKSFMRGTTDEIDPHSFLSVKSKHLITAVPKSQEFDDADEDEIENLSAANKMSLVEAFENDDIVNDFIEETTETTKVDEVVEKLPGWGSWDGHNIKKKTKFNQKPLPYKRKDRIIINNRPNEKLRKHLISSVPFPFTTVKDFEASMRLPIGKDFIPSSAYSKLTKSSIVTKAGTIIDPMTEDVLVQNKGGAGKRQGKKGKIFKRKNLKA